MSYRIQYRSYHAKKRRLAIKMRLPALTVLSFLVFLFLVNIFWPEGSACLGGILENRMAMVSAGALDRFAAELYDGEPLTEAFSAFLDAIQP